MKKRLKLLGITFLIFGICLVCGLVIPSDSAVYPVGGNIMVPAATDTRTSVELPVLMYHSISDDSAKNEYNNACDLKNETETSLENIVKSLENAVLEIWSDKEKMKEYCKNARKHAEKNHDKERNYRRMTEIYAEINS